MDYKKMFTLLEVPKGYIIKKYKAKDLNVVIPETIDDKPVVAIGDMAFKGKEIEEVVIPESIIAIGERAFCDCKNLKKVTLNHKVVMERFVFTGCELLADEKGFVIVGGILGDYYGNENNVVIPEGVTIVDDSAFSKAKKILESVVVPASVEELRCNAFYSCRKLKSVTLNSENIKLEASSFENCDGLVDSNGFIILNDILCAYRDENATDVVIPGNVKRIAQGALSTSRGLKSVVISDGVEKIDAMAFAFSHFERISIPSSVTLIGEKAFYNGEATITAPKKSYAIEYAKENGIPFVEE